MKNYASVNQSGFNRTNQPFWQHSLRLKSLLLGITGLSAMGIAVLTQWSVNAQNIARNTQQTGQWLNASFPVENFQTYTSPFGYRQSPITGKTQFHRGLDLAAPMGSYIRNWWGGKITQLSDHTACGTMVIIQSGQWEHIYCHLKGRVQNTSAGLVLIDREGGIRLRQGQHIATGTRIGRVGMTGRTTGPHLHWGLKYAGEYIDPGLVLRQMYQEQAAVQ